MLSAESSQASPAFNRSGPCQNASTICVPASKQTNGSIAFIPTPIAPPSNPPNSSAFNRTAPRAWLSRSCKSLLAQNYWLCLKAVPFVPPITAAPRKPEAVFAGQAQRADHPGGKGGHQRCRGPASGPGQRPHCAGIQDVGRNLLRPIAPTRSRSTTRPVALPAAIPAAPEMIGPHSLVKMPTPIPTTMEIVCTAGFCRDRHVRRDVGLEGGRAWIDHAQPLQEDALHGAGRSSRRAIRR